MVEGAPGFQRPREQIGIFEKHRFFEQAVAPFKQGTGDEIIVRQGFEQPLGGFGRRAGGLGRPGQMNIGQASSALLRIERQPEADRELALLLLLAAGFRHRIAQQGDRAEVDRFVTTAVRQPRQRITINRQSQQSPNKGQHTGSEMLHGIGLGRAGHQKLFGRLFAHPDAHILDCFDDLRTPCLLFLEQQITQGLACQNFLVARLDRLEHRRNPGLFRKGSEQRLAKAMDRHDPQAAALRIQNAGK